MENSNFDKMKEQITQKILSEKEFEEIAGVDIESVIKEVEEFIKTAEEVGNISYPGHKEEPKKNINLDKI